MLNLGELFVTLHCVSEPRLGFAQIAGCKRDLAKPDFGGCRQRWPHWKCPWMLPEYRADLLNPCHDSARSFDIAGAQANAHNTNISVKRRRCQSS